MKISEFKINKKLVFTNGEVKVEKNNLDDKIVQFNELNFSLLMKINDEVISKLKSTETEVQILYKLLPYLTDIEMDISVNEFEEMLKLPSKEFLNLYEAIIDEMNIIIETYENISQLEKKNNSITKKMNKIMSKKK